MFMFQICRLITRFATQTCIKHICITLKSDLKKTKGSREVILAADRIDCSVRE